MTTTVAFSGWLSKRSQGKRSPFKAWGNRLITLETAVDGFTAVVRWYKKEGAAVCGELILGSSSILLDSSSAAGSVAAGCLQIEGPHRTLLLRGQPDTLRVLTEAVQKQLGNLAGAAAAPARENSHAAPAAGGTHDRVALSREAEHATEKALEVQWLSPNIIPPCA